MKAKQTKMKKVLSIVLAAAMLLNPLSLVGQLFPGGTAEAASYLPMPEAPGYRLLNKRMAANAFQYRQSYSMGEEMEKTGSTGGGWMASRYGEIGMDGATVFGGRSSWSVTFEKKDFTGTLPDEVRFLMGGAVTNSKGSSVRLGDGVNFGESCSKNGLTKDYATGWLPLDGGIKAVVRGSGGAEVTFLWYVLADITSPGENGWKMEVTTDTGGNTPVLWLWSAETLRPANAEITTELLSNIHLELGLVPRKNPGDAPIYVTAKAVKLSDDSKGIGFRVQDSDWKNISGKEYQIVSIKNASVLGRYKLVEYSGLNGNMDVNLPITDIAGNPVQLPGTALNVKAQGLILDVLPPRVEAVKLTGTAVDTSVQTSPEEWPADIDRSKLFSTVGDEVQLRLQLSEVVVHPSAEQMKNVVLTWNIARNGTPVTSRLTAIEEGYSNGVNGGIVSTLVFEKIKITKDMTPQGERLQAVSMTGGELLRDSSKNFMAQGGQTLDVSGVSPDCSNFLDTQGPTGGIEGNIVSNIESNEAYYMVPLSIRDGSDGVQAAGIAGQMGQISLTSYTNAPQMSYEYQVSNSPSKPDSWSGKGTVGGEGNEVWSSFPTTGNGAYYLHLKLADIAGKELDDAKGLTLKLQLTDILANTSEVSLSLKDLALDQVGPQLSLAQKKISVTTGDSGSAVSESESSNAAQPGNSAVSESGSSEAAQPGNSAVSESGSSEAAQPGSNAVSGFGSSEVSQSDNNVETGSDGSDIEELSNDVSGGDYGISALSGATGDNTAVFEAEAEASDLNGIAQMEYQWTDANATESNAWTVVKAAEDGTFPASMIQSLTDSVSGQQTVSRTLHVRAYDKYGNYTEKTLTMAADLSKAVGQFQIAGDPDTPSADTDMLIAKPIATGADSSADNASTRATVEIGGKTYVRIFKDAEPKSLLDKNASDWYEVVIGENGNYTSVTGGQKPDWSYYGAITITLAHSLQDLTPAIDNAVNNETDITLVQDAPLTFLYAPACQDVHTVAFTGVENSAGEALSPTTASGYIYHKMDRSMAGTRFVFTLKNGKVESWNQRDVDFGASYAVLVKTDAQGNPSDEAEVTARVPLSSGESQSFSVPSSDKDGNAFASGGYVLKVYVRQKAGGEQTFYSDKPLLLDASGIPSQFGVLSYTGTTRTVFTDNSDEGAGLDQTYQAAEGEVLHTVNVGVAKPDELDLGMDPGSGMPTTTPGTLMEIGGHAAYLTAVQNALRGSRFSYSGGDFELKLIAKWNGGEEPGEYLGVKLGQVKGIKYWNSASNGNPAELLYTKPEAVEGDSSAAMITLKADIKWYAEKYDGCVVSREELSQKPLDKFALALGGNTICYQLKMENGLESPIYQFELNLCDQAPTLELDYDFGPSVLRKDEIDVTSTSKALTKYAEYIDVSVKDAFSVYGDLTIYHAHYDNDTKEWNYDKVEQGGKIHLTRSGNGYAGFFGTDTNRNNKNYTTREFICVVDAAGNAVSAYPILADAAVEDAAHRGDENKIYYYGIKEDCAVASVDELSVIEGTQPAEYQIPFTAGKGDDIKRTMDYYTLQIDDREPVRVDMGWDDYSYHFQDISNQAGITGLRDKAVDFVLPYDPEAEEGAQVSHTVKITTYGYKETPDSQPVTETKEFTITGTNRKPQVKVNAESGSAQIGSVPILTTALVQDTSAGIYFWNNSSMYVYSNGTYTLNLEDKYGEKYIQELTVDCLPEDPKIDISTTEPTAGPVVITATSDTYLLATSISNGGAAGGTEEEPIKQPEVKGEGSKNLVITVPENCSFSIYWNEEGENVYDGERVEIAINNIDNKAIDPEVQWQYDESVVEDGNIYRGEVTAILVDKNGKNLMDPLTGSRPSYVFVPGGETEYTFSGYVDEAGKTGPDITATLPVTLRPYETQIEDIYAPDLAITGYVIRRGVSTEVQAAYIQAHDRPEGSRVGLPDYGDENKYGAENVFTDMQDMTDKMFWAESYLLRVETADESAVRLFVKKNPSGPDAVPDIPDYASGTSDAIKGVSLTGRTLQITENTEFVLYAVDEKGNSSTVPIRVTALGSLPDPEYMQVLTKTGGEVRIYLIPPALEGVRNLRITNDDDNDGNPDALTEEDPESAFHGQSYLAVKENKKILLHYSYDYFDTEWNGSLEIDVSGIDGDPAGVRETTWSANYDSAGGKYTNQEISVQIQFDKPLGKVTLSDADGVELPVNPGTVAVAWLENRVTVVYEENAPGYRMKVAALANARETVVDLPEIKTIDRTPPQVSASIAYAENHRSAAVTITSDEEVILSRTGAKGTKFQQTVKENGTFTYSVVDRAGNQAEASVTVSDLITEELTLLLSTDGTDTSVIDPETYEAKVGDQLYAKTNRQATLFLNGRESGQMSAGAWIPFTIAEDSEGVYPSVRAVDGYGNAALVQMLRIPMRDRTAPVLLLVKKQLSASSRKSDEELRAMLLANAIYSDDTTPQDRLTVEIEFDRSSAEARIPATYTITDEAGNKAEEVCWLRLHDGSEPQVTVNGNPIEWEETMAVQSGKQVIHIQSMGEPYKVYQKAGIKTEAQMKTGSVLLSAYTAEKEQELTLETAEPGYYTFCIITQGRKTCRFVLYVEE